MIPGIRAASILSSILLLSVSVSAENIRSLKNGISTTVGGEEMEITVASPHAFRLHISDQSRSAAKASIFLAADAQPANTAFNIIHDGVSIIGIKTAFGELKVDTDKKMWSLLDGSGTVLADWATLGTIHSATLPTNEEETLSFSVGPASDKSKPLYYASGNLPVLGALTQINGFGRVANGKTALPQFWSNAGYGALLVGQSDNQPGGWKQTDNGLDLHVPGLSADLYIAPAANLYDWLRDYSELTGFAPVPPRWSFGYLQSRWGWKDKQYIDDTFAHFRKDQLPVDAFIFDFEWYSRKPDYAVKAPGDPSFDDFDWNADLLPDPKIQLADFAKDGLHIIGIRKPRLGNSDNLKMAREKNWILPPTNISGFDSNTDSRTLDFANLDVQKWWEENNRKFVEAGVSGFWNDEGEKSFTEYYYWNTAQAALLAQVHPHARFWSINRSFEPGLARLGASVWTGDIDAAWDVLQQTPGELLSYGLSGMPYSACDIGGFFHTPSPELMTRWMEAGVFFPIMRSHSERSETPRFPWLYGSDAEQAIRKALNLRYQLIPYYYSLAHQAHDQGAPLMRPLVMEFPDDDAVSGMTDEWLMGKGLLAAPQLKEGGTRDVYLPEDQWFTFGTNQMIRGPQTLSVTSKLDEIPIYIRAGTLLPLGPLIQNTGEISTAPLELEIYPGRDATFDFAEDDGNTLTYQKGNVRRTTFSWNDQTKILTWKSAGNYSGGNVFRVVNANLFSSQGQVTKRGALGRDGAIGF